MCCVSISLTINPWEHIDLKEEFLQNQLLIRYRLNSVNVTHGSVSAGVEIVNPFFIDSYSDIDTITIAGSSVPSLGPPLPWLDDDQAQLVEKQFLNKLLKISEEIKL